MKIKLIFYIYIVYLIAVAHKLKQSNKYYHTYTVYIYINITIYRVGFLILFHTPWDIPSVVHLYTSVCASNRFSPFHLYCIIQRRTLQFNSIPSFQAQKSAHVFSALNNPKWVWLQRYKEPQQPPPLVVW